MPSSTEEFLSEWKEMVATCDHSALDHLLADNPTIKSPAFFAPKTSKPYVRAILESVNEIMQDFTYTRIWEQDNVLLLEFDARVGDDTQIKGIDIVTLDEESRLKEIEVLIRPMNGLIAMAEAVKARLSKAEAS